MSQKYPGGFITKSPTAPTTAAAKGIWTLDQVTNYRKQGIWPATPGAPTIGTATAVTSTTATVTYTAPTNLGAGTVTYTATSSPGGLTGTGASPITVSGLTESTSYTFTVTAATPGGTSPASAASNSITTPVAPPSVIGQAYGGGYYAGKIGVGGVATHYLIVGPVASAQNSSRTFGTSGVDTGATSNIDGPTNSATLEAYNAPAADFCEALSIGGYTDWYLPAKNELEVCYYFLKPSTNSNNTSWGSNANAVSPEPISTNYSSGSPAQTSATAFRTSGGEEFSEQYYWSSTESSSTAAWIQTFSSGLQDPDSKNNARYVRAVRRIAI